MIPKIVSGGQTGADRAALDWAIQHQIPHAGWCPKGRRAEDGTIDQRYNLTETTIGNYEQRTECNVRDSDGTVIFTISSKPTGGSKKTMELAEKHKKPCLHVHSGLQNPGASLARFVTGHNIKVLNVAGSRGSKEPQHQTRPPRHRHVPAGEVTSFLGFPGTTRPWQP